MPQMNGHPLRSGHLWSKHIFWEKEWSITQEAPPEGSGRRRVDVTIRYLGDKGQIAVLAFHEAKPFDATPQDIQDAERQAYEACTRYLNKPGNERLGFVYAITTFGTRGRAWVYVSGEDYLTPLLGSEDLAERSEYIDVHTSQAQELQAEFIKMKTALPK